MALNARYRVPLIWRGRDVVIIAGGPSLTLKQIRTIAIARNRNGSNVRVMVVNDAVYAAWFADWLHACDAKWWRWNIQSVHRFSGTRTTLAEDIPAKWVDGHLKETGQDGFDPDPSCCRTGRNSGYQAMHIAAHTGARRIILVGFDMKAAAGGPSHWFGEHSDRTGRSVPAAMKNSFPGLADYLVTAGIEVLNASIDSALECFRRVDLEEALGKS